jgi:hypothetical protein
MFRNYLAAALRNLVRNRLYAAINIIGLAVGFAAALLIALFVRDEFSYDEWLPGHERTYLIYERYAPPDRAPISVNVTFSAMAKLLPVEFPDIETVTRLQSAELRLRHGDIEAAEPNTFWADANFFDVLPFKAIAGDLETALSHPDGIVLTRALARKYFGKDTPIGESIELDRKQTLQVRAVIEDLPSNTHLAIGAVPRGSRPSPASRGKMPIPPMEKLSKAKAITPTCGCGRGRRSKPCRPACRPLSNGTGDSCSQTYWTHPPLLLVSCRWRTFTSTRLAFPTGSRPATGAR